jgi:hypothetical protein
MKVFICLSALFAMAQCGPLNQYLASGAAAGPLHPAVGALAATKRGWRNIALEGFSEDDNQDGFVDPIGAAVVAAPVTYAAHYPYVHHAVAPVVKVAEAPKVEAKATPVLTYAAPHVYTGYTVAHTPAATVPLTYTHTVPAGVITHPYAYGFPYGYAVAAPAKAEEAAETITEA